MSQAELARRSGLSKTTISNLESGRLKRIELTTIAKLCQALSCCPNDLFEFAEHAELHLVQRQKDALRKVLGTVQFEKAYKAETLDSDLSEIVGQELENCHDKSSKSQSA